MKKITNCLICLMLTGLMSVTAFAQATLESKNEPRSLTDRTVSDRLHQDLYKRNANLKDQPISWFDMGEGYYGTYSSNNQNYMTRYDKEGNYIETMTKKEWNDNVPSSVRTSFDGSPYKSQKVTSYWEVSDPNTPPPPYPAREPFEPYGVAAVELAKERMVVLGQLATGTDIAGLTVGAEMELVVEPLYEDDESVHTVWKWQATGTTNRD